MKELKKLPEFSKVSSEDTLRKAAVEYNSSSNNISKLDVDPTGKWKGNAS
jgi:hypothetical protein